MTTRDNKVWEGEGLLWRNLTIYETAEGMVGVLSDSKSFMEDREIKFPDDLRPFQELIAEIQKMDSDYYDELTLYADEEEFDKGSNGESKFSTIDGALENWGRLNENRHVWKEINEVLSRLEVKLGRLTELHIPRSQSYVAAHFSGNPTSIGAYINVGHVDHNEFLEGSEWSEIRRNYRSYLSTSAGNVPKRIVGVGKKSNPCPTCGIVMSQANSCDYCP
jgi:hypothetical protein